VTGWPWRAKPLPGPMLPLGTPPAWRRLIVRLRPSRRGLRSLRLTREGWVFSATALAVALAALNTGNNLLYLVLAAMLSLVVVSGILSESALRHLEVRRRFDEQAWAGRPVRGAWILRSRRRLLPAVAIDLEELGVPGARLERFGEASVAWLPAGGEERRTATWRFGGRGLHQLERIRLSTTWPFGILRKGYEVRLPARVLVFAQPGPDHAALVRSRAGRQGLRASLDRRGRGGDLRGLRDHRSGEDLKLVHWRSSARLRRRVVVERDAEAGGVVEVRVAAPGEGSLRERLTAFEGTVRQATGAVVAATDRGDDVELGLPTGPPSTGKADALLGRLAVLRLDEVDRA
jgi:uncharacterized protein (DUF58 family)